MSLARLLNPQEQTYRPHAVRVRQDRCVLRGSVYALNARDAAERGFQSQDQPNEKGYRHADYRIMVEFARDCYSCYRSRERGDVIRGISVNSVGLPLRCSRRGTRGKVPGQP